MMRRGLPHDGRHHCQQRALLLLVERRAFRADMRRGYVPYDPSPCSLSLWPADGLAGRYGPQDGDPRAALGVNLRCACQIAGHISGACAARGWCQERRPESVQGTIPTGRGYPDTPEMR
jgi:hypothetical protein